MTLPLHCAELLVNMVHDEANWRKSSKEGRSRSNALGSMLGSLPALAFFIFKPVTHWLYSLAISIYFSIGIDMRPPQILYLGVGAAFVALFITACAFWRPKVPQPATFGHLQTLVDVVDYWPNKDEKMYRGQKKPENPRQFIGVVQDKVLNHVSIISTEADAMSQRDRYFCHAGTAAEPCSLSPLMKCTWVVLEGLRDDGHLDQDNSVKGRQKRSRTMCREQNEGASNCSAGPAGPASVAYA